MESDECRRERIESLLSGHSPTSSRLIPPSHKLPAGSAGSSCWLVGSFAPLPGDSSLGASEAQLPATSTSYQPGQPSRPFATVPKTMRMRMPPFDVSKTGVNRSPVWPSSFLSADAMHTDHPGHLAVITFPNCAYRLRTRSASPTRTPYGGFVATSPGTAGGSMAEIGRTARSMSSATPARSALELAAWIAPASRSDA